MRRARIALSLATFLVASAASANGRFPRAQRFIESADEPNRLALYGTYGLLVTEDAGHTWSHVCEAAVGPYTERIPLLELLPSARILARTESALVTSGDTWCNWKTVLDGTTRSIQDITRDPSAPLTVLGLLGAYAAGTGFSSLLVESTDAGASWSVPRELPRDQIARGLSLEVAASNPKRIIVSGLDSTSMGRLLVSDDRGASFQGRALGNTDANAVPYIAAMSKTDENRIFVRTDAYQDINGIDTANDALLLSVDGGAGWITLIQRHAKLFGFALSPDESTLLVGYGDPVVSATEVDPSDLGIYRANVATILANPAGAPAAFLKIFEGSVTCLRWTPTALFACTSQSERGFEVGKAPNAAFALSNPQPFSPLLLLPSVRPLACAAGTNAYVCYTDPTYGFPAVCGTLQASCDASPPAPGASNEGGPPGTGSGGNALGSTGGAPGSADDGGATSPRGAGGRSRSDAGLGPTPRHADGACACRTAPVRGVNGFALGTGVAVALLFGARRFAARRSPNPR